MRNLLIIDMEQNELEYEDDELSASYLRSSDMQHEINVVAKIAECEIIDVKESSDCEIVERKPLYSIFRTGPKTNSKSKNNNKNNGKSKNNDKIKVMLNERHMRKGKHNHNNWMFTVLNTIAGVKGQVYKITCLVNSKVYGGKTRTHIKSKGKYVPAGYIRRFLQHIYESRSNRQMQCVLLNNAIRKYGAEKFVVELVCECELSEVDEMEKKFIRENDLTNPAKGYNIRNGGGYFKR
jgi:hypothetical protein